METYRESIYIDRDGRLVYTDNDLINYKFRKIRQELPLVYKKIDKIYLIVDIPVYTFDSIFRFLNNI